MLDPASPASVASNGDAAVRDAERARAEPSVWAYCRELCSPADCERAVAATLAALEDGGAHSIANENRLLLITRAAAAQFASAGRHGPLAGDGPVSGRDQTCATIPAQLAAGASGALEPGQRRQLDEHLSKCLVCKATEFKMRRAEREFAVMQAVTAPSVPKRAVRAAGSTVLTPRPAERPERAPERSTPPPERTLRRTPAPEPAVRGPERTVPSVQPERADLARSPAGVDRQAATASVSRIDLGRSSGRAEAAVRAYCRELCGPTGSGLAVAAILESVDGSSPASGEKLIRATRLMAAKHALGEDKKGKRSRDCAATAERLAARANGDLEPAGRRQLDAHLRECIPCQAVQIRMKRAERAFATMVGARAVAEQHLARAKARPAAVELPVPAPPASRSAPEPRSAPQPRHAPTVGRGAPDEPRDARTVARRAPIEPLPVPIESHAPVEPPRAPVEPPRAPVEPPPAPVELPTAAIEPPAPARVEPRRGPVEPPPAPKQPPAAAESIRWPREKAADDTLAAAAAGAAVAGTGATAARAAGVKVKPPATRKKARAGRQQRSGTGKRGLIVLALAVVVAAAVAAALVLTAGTTSPRTPAARAVVTPAAPAAKTPATVTHRAVKAKTVSHPRPAKRRAPAKAKARRAAKPVRKAATPAAAAPAVAVVPAAPRTVAPVVRKPPTVRATKPTSPSVTPQGSSLPAQKAPTQGISGGK